MLCAFHRMCFSKPNSNCPRKINARTFEKYRLEYIENISKIMSENQKGEKNSQFGKSWFTNRNTGECKFFKEPPDETWIKGRNLFKGERSVLFWYVKQEISNGVKLWYKNNSEVKSKVGNRKRKSNQQITVYSLTTLEPLILTDGVIPEGYDIYENAFKNFKKLEAQKYWDEFHLGNYISFKEFSKTIKISQPALTEKLKKYIPLYKILVKKRFDAKSDINLVGKYE